MALLIPQCPFSSALSLWVTPIQLMESLLFPNSVTLSVPGAESAS